MILYVSTYMLRMKIRILRIRRKKTICHLNLGKAPRNAQETGNAARLEMK